MDNDRRDFIFKAGVISTAAMIGGIASESFASPMQNGSLTRHTLNKLPYAYDALEPVIDAKTLELHYTKHHQAYVDGLIKAEEQINKARTANDFSMIQHWSRQAAFHGAGVYLHSLYWESMTPNSPKRPQGLMEEMIEKSFGTFELFKSQFAAAAKSVEASGWAILGYRKHDDRLLIYQVENHQKLTTWNIEPVLCIDVWEHAYYLKYQNKRADYVDGWWNIVNWSGASQKLSELK